MAKLKKQSKHVTTLTHKDASRKNIPTTEDQAVMSSQDRDPVIAAFERRTPDLDPQFVWRGKDVRNWHDLIVRAPPLYIEEKVHPKALIDDLKREMEERTGKEPRIPDLFADFNGLPPEAERTDFYQHEGNWSNRMILGDSLHVMASLAEREALRGKVQCIYFDPPYGIKFNSNFQPSTSSRDVTDGKREHITREPEQVKAFRDTWKDGIHSYLTYLRDRLTVARDLLTESGSIFVQIGDENVHRVRALMDEILGTENLIAELVAEKTAGASMQFIDSVSDYILWYGKNRDLTKYRRLFLDKKEGKTGLQSYKFLQLDDSTRRPLSQTERQAPVDIDKMHIFSIDGLTSQTQALTTRYTAKFRGREYKSGVRQWATPAHGFERLCKANRVENRASSLGYVRFFRDYPVMPIRNIWTDTGTGSFTDPKVYVVQTGKKIVERCILMTTDPGDLVLDPTCGSGTTAYVAEQWGRRWITIDTSRVALALARTRIMGARYPYYLLTDSLEGQQKEAEITRKAPSSQPAYGNIRQGFVYRRVPHITLKSIANNAEIDIIYDRLQPKVDAALAALNTALEGHATSFAVDAGGRKGQKIDFTDATDVTLPSGETASANALLEWEVPRDLPDDWPDSAKKPHEAFWQARIARQKEIDASIAAKADFEYLFDKPYEDSAKVRVSGPFTVETLSPHRMIGFDQDGREVDSVREARVPYGVGQDFAGIMLENLKTSGVQQVHKEQRIEFTSLTAWPGPKIDAEGRFVDRPTSNSRKEAQQPKSANQIQDQRGQYEFEQLDDAAAEKRAAIFIGPEFGTVTRPHLIEAAREAAEMGTDILIACAFSFDAGASDTSKYGRMPILKARMNADLHMVDDLKNTGSGNLFVVFGDPDIDVLSDEKDADMIRVKVNGTDVYDPKTGQIRSNEPNELACWFIDTDYNQESFFVRHAYFLGASDPYKSLKTTLKGDIDADAWATLKSDVSRPFKKPESGRIAVKVINHFGDEVMKVVEI